MVIFDDIGSYPLPDGRTREWVENASQKEFFQVVQEAMQDKIRAGVELPNYPQFRDMNQMFLEVINNPGWVEEPFLVREERAEILELKALEPLLDEMPELKLRVCVTGPVELYLQQFGGASYPDILVNLARSVDRFISRALKTDRVGLVSLDEPSIGVNPQLMLTESEIADALSKAASSAARQGIDVMVHFHSPLHYRLACEVDEIKVIGVESAASPSYLDLIDRGELEGSDTFLRLGVSRTDIHNMVAQLNEKYNMNIWRSPEMLWKVTRELETPETIKKRLEKGHRMFEGLVKYAGPDCGLGSWPSQALARELLQNTGTAISEHNRLIEQGR